MVYVCNLCNFSSDNLFNYNTHLDTKSHILLFTKNEKIQETRRINKQKKEDKLSIKLDKIEEKIDISNKKIEEYNKKTGKKLEQIEKAQKETIKGVKKITNYIEFLNEHCIDAKPLTLLTTEEVDILLRLDEYEGFEFEEMIIKYIKSNRLNIKIGNLILSKFLKPNNLKNQQVWTSDISRLIYLILQMIGKQKGWVRDKKGEIFTELITMPIIERLNVIMTNYAKHCIKSFNENRDHDENAVLLDYAQTAKDSTSKFYNDFVNKETLKFMASKFSVSTKKEEINKLC